MSNSAIGLVLDFFCLSMTDVANELGIPSYLCLTSGAFFLGTMLYLASHDESTGTVLELSGPELRIPSFTNPVPSRVLPEPMVNRDGGYAAFAKLAKRFKETKVELGYRLDRERPDYALAGRAASVVGGVPVLWKWGDESLVVKAGKIDEVIWRAMEKDGGARERMKEMSEKSRKAVMKGGSSFNSFGNLIRDMIKNSM
ncbi:hypothetical protein RJ641_015719 [Dillenia turbinata]|uniref:Uncharacterized protein n=1 Tax=Dillenia turbinata TaxID=194707 RepID=A0AAN8Z1D0_9MAGN